MASVKQVDQATFQQLLANDPDVQAVIQRVWGDGPRPGDTPKNLEKANHDASQQIAQILKAKGVQLPPHTFINPRTNALEAEHGWAGLPTGVKIAIIAGGALATGGALGAFGGAAAGAGAGAGGSAAGGAGGLGAGLGAATAGLPAGLTGAGIAGTGSMAAGLGGAGAAAGLGGGAAAGGGGILSTLGKLAGSKGVGAMGDVLGKQQQGAAQGLIAESQLGQGQDRNAVDLYQAQNTAQQQQAAQDLQRKQFETTNRSSTARQALLASLLGGGYEGSNVSVPGITNAKVSGGLLDSLKNNPGALAAMQKLAAQASTAQDTPLQFQGGQPVAPPTLTPLPQQGKGSKMMDALSRIAQVGGAVNSMRGGQ